MLSYSHIPYLLSFPTRRSSDLSGVGPPVGEEGRQVPGAAAQVDDLLRLLGRHARQQVGERPPALVGVRQVAVRVPAVARDRKSTRLNSSHLVISYAVFCLKKKI